MRKIFDIGMIVIICILGGVLLMSGIFLIKYYNAVRNSEKSMANYSDLSFCGNFEQAPDGGGPSTYYFVCRDQESGDCYYKTSYFRQIIGCNAAFSDENPYGRQECFESLNDVYGFNGTAKEKGKKDYRLNDVCRNTSQRYFESKISQ